LSKGYCNSLKNLYLLAANLSKSLIPDANDFSKIYLEMTERTLSPSYITNMIKMAKHFCDFSEVEQGLPANPGRPARLLERVLQALSV
jgi:hypothetical protein